MDLKKAQLLESDLVPAETSHEGEMDVEPRFTKTYSRFNSPFWQVIVVSCVAFGYRPSPVA